MALPADAPSSRTAGVVGAVVVAVVVGAAAFGLWLRSRAGSGGSVVVVGDSVTYGASPAIQQRLQGSAQLDVIAKPFYRTIDLVVPLQQIIDARRAAGEPLERVMVLAGYNDVIREDQDQSGLPRLLELAGQFDCAVWLTLPARPGGQPAGHQDFPPEEATAWNERVREEVASTPQAYVSDEWQRTVEAEGGAALLQEDGVHPVRAGHLALAEAMDQALAEECPS